MEVLVGPTFGIEIASSAAAEWPQEKLSSSSCLFSKEVDDAGGSPSLNPIPTPAVSDRGFPDVSSESSSSIGARGDSDGEDDEEEGVVSSGVSLGLGSLEDSLHIKRGLSNHYAGKSKSFVNLSDAISSVKDLQKTENPFNKRRRLLIANKWKWSKNSSSSSSFYSWQNPNSMPLLALNEEDEDDKQMTSSSSSSSSSSNDTMLRAAAATKPKLRQSALMMAASKSHSCFSLTDLED